MNDSNPNPITFSRQFNSRIFGCVGHTHNAREKSKAVGAHDSFLIHALKTLQKYVLLSMSLVKMTCEWLQ